MKFKALIANLGLSLFLVPLLAHAHLRPVASLALGLDVVTNLHMRQNITLIAPFQNSYVANNRIVDAVGGLFVGFEAVLAPRLQGQLGLSYYQNQGYQLHGLVYQFTNPAFANLNYQYIIQSQRLMVESKILITWREYFHPFVDVGVGEAINTANRYNETPVTSASVPMPYGFKSQTNHSFAYMAGLGLEADLNPHVRLGGLYRYLNLGRDQLGGTPIQQSQDRLKNHLSCVNEFLLQLSYLG